MVIKEKKQDLKRVERRRARAHTPDAREQQLISLATDLAEKQLRDGTASAQVVTFYLKLGSSTEALEQERLGSVNRLLRAKTDAIADAKNSQVLFSNAVEAMRTYGGQPQEMEADDDIDE